MNQVSYADQAGQPPGKSPPPTTVHIHYVLDLASKLESAVKQLTLRMTEAFEQAPRHTGQLASVERQETAQAVGQILRIREKRASEFGELFGDPAWDILIFLLWAHGEQLRMSVGNVCDGAGVAPSTGLR